MINKKDLSERDICTKYITPAIEKAGWDKFYQIREEVYFTDGRIIVRGENLIARGKPKKADYILYYKDNIPLAVIEAKKNKYPVGEGMQQALEYAQILDIPFVYTSNGDSFLEHDKTITDGQIEKEINLNSFPSPIELWNRYKIFKGIKEYSEEEIITQDYYFDNKTYKPRYYQIIAINRTIEAIAKGQKRIILVMATGTGKTQTAFQIIWRLWKSEAKKRILFLADRNILVDQTMNNDFAPFKGAMTKIKNRKIDKSYEIYLSLYQGITGKEEFKNIYREFTPDFFDLIVIDECHRGSASEDSAWRDILTYFSSATQIGLTATPKETKDISNLDYFGEPIYTYSLKQGIEDGFLAPYKVIRCFIDIDEGWIPEEGKLDKHGNLIPVREYNLKDYDKELILEKRTELVAKRVSEFLKNTNRFDKTIIFCERTEHAERMRKSIVNENPDLVYENSKYVMRITGDDEIGKAELDKFIHPEEKYPVIATTSQLMTTGIDAKTCKLIVLDRTINSMTEFKQIIGRGTRLREDFGKYFFTIIDFRNATRLFQDPNFDGDPVQIYEPKENDEMKFPEGDNNKLNDPEIERYIYKKPDISINPLISEATEKYYINDVEVKLTGEKVQYYGKDGKLITESIKDYTKKTIKQDFVTLNDFIKKWNSSDKKKVIIDELLEKGIIFEALEKEIGKEFDPFDLICHIAFDKEPLTRKERANNVKKRNYFAKYSQKAKEVIESLLDKYANEGIENVEDNNILRIPPFNNYGSILEIVKLFGGKEKYKLALKELEDNIYLTGT